MKTRKASALLIVLGMMSFLIVSAVSFSFFMRQSRLPSSFLRRTVASRQMVKAALTRAIDEIDQAIGNNPHPNFGGNYNVWHNRIYFGTNMLSSVAETVPVLTLEGLAYIPPPLVNAARYYSRLTPSSKWKHFSFDTGRYAFTAIDVSDYFDINRMFADKPRSSASNRKVTLAHIFEEGAEHASAPTAAPQWDQFMERFREVDENLNISYESKFPFISLCDFNLALGAAGSVGKVKSYFYDFLTSGGSRAGYYNTRSTDDEDMVERQTFVTDFLSSRNYSGSLEYSENALNVANLARADNQPFKIEDLQRENASAANVMLGELCQTKSTKPYSETFEPVTDSAGGEFLWQNYIGGVGLAALWDYLDYDQTPISLAVPSCERIAMIAGVEPMLRNDSAIKLVREMQHNTVSTIPPENPGGETKQVVETVVRYKLSLRDLIEQTSLVKALAVYPFSRNDELETSKMKFKVDGRFSFFFTKDEPMGLRTSKADKLHPAVNQFSAQTAPDPSTGQIFINLSQQGVGVEFDPSSVESEKDAIRMVSGAGSTSLLSLGNALAVENALAEPDKLFLELKYRWERRNDMAMSDDEYVLSNVMRNPGSQNSDGTKYLQYAKSMWRPLNSRGEPEPEDGAFSQDNLLSKFMSGYGASAGTVYFNSAVYLRVKSDGDNQKVVDMVPACFEDDVQIGSSGGSGIAGQLMSEIGKQLAGAPYPVLKFDTAGGPGQNVEIVFSVEKLNEFAESPKRVTLYPKSAIVSDPRWNFAPEYWYSMQESLTEESWLKNCHRDEGDGDIFMATSDQGYLQSKYELAFLPRVKNFAPSSGAMIGGSMSSLNNAGRSHIAQSFTDTLNHSYMWKMFDPIDEDYDEFRRFPFANIGSGMKVNPYSDSTNVIISAFANTPVDWRMASTNNTMVLEEMSAADFNKKYAYCAYAEDEANKVTWEELKEFAGTFMDKMRSGDRTLNWSDGWVDLDWFGNETSLWGKELDNAKFWGVDKRYLYGYWSDCFAAEQQLFLIFVRSEPLMMGGGSINHVPPQLGARAVALVWRDPSMPKDSSAPHKTRILFYRHFD